MSKNTGRQVSRRRSGKWLLRAAQLFLQYLQEEGEEEVADLLALDQGSGIVE